MDEKTHFIQVSEGYFQEQFSQWEDYPVLKKQEIRAQFIQDIAEGINNGKTIVNSSKHITVHEISQYIISTE